MRLSLLLTIFCLGTLLGACENRPIVDPPDESPPLDFATDPRILRGVWTGTNEDGDTLLLDLNASEPTADSYLVTGTFQLNDEEPVVIEGRHFVPLTASTHGVSVMVSPTDPFQAASVTPAWEIMGSTPEGTPPTFGMWLINAGTASHFELTAQGTTALLGTEWQLETLRGEPLLAESSITLEFGEAPHEGFSGYDGCNYYGARYLATELTFEIVYGIGSTAMACETPDGVMDQASEYATAFSDATTYRITDDTLEFMGETGATLLAFSNTEQASMDSADLLETSWQLVSINEETRPPEAEATLAFPRARVMTAQAGCVSYYAVYNASGNDVHLEQLGANYDACAEGEALEGIEAAYSDALSTASDFEVSALELKLYTRQGDRLVFQPIQ